MQQLISSSDQNTQLAIRHAEVQPFPEKCAIFIKKKFADTWMNQTSLTIHNTLNPF